MTLDGFNPAWIALFLSLFASAGVIYQLWGYWRFRKPLFIVESAEFKADRANRDGKTTWRLNAGKVIVNARGASRPIPIVGHCIRYPHVGNPEVAAGFGVGSLQGLEHPIGQYLIELPYITHLSPETWTRFELWVAEGMAIAYGDDDEDVRIPRTVEMDLYFESPEEQFRPIELALVRSGDQEYTLDRRLKLVRRSDNMYWRGSFKRRLKSSMKQFLNLISRWRSRSD